MTSRRFDEEGYERRDRYMGSVECSECGKDVSLRADTDEWVQMRDRRRWRHVGYGPATGVCCGLLYAESMYGGVDVFYLRKPNVSQASTHNESAPEGSAA